MPLGKTYSAVKDTLDKKKRMSQVVGIEEQEKSFAAIREKVLRVKVSDKTFKNMYEGIPKNCAPVSLGGVDTARLHNYATELFNLDPYAKGINAYLENKEGSLKGNDKGYASFTALLKQLFDMYVRFFKWLGSYFPLDDQENLSQELSIFSNKVDAFIEKAKKNCSDSLKGKRIKCLTAAQKIKNDQASQKSENDQEENPQLAILKKARLFVSEKGMLNEVAALGASEGAHSYVINFAKQLLMNKPEKSHNRGSEKNGKMIDSLFLRDRSEALLEDSSHVEEMLKLASLAKKTSRYNYQWFDSWKGSLKGSRFHSVAKSLIAMSVAQFIAKQLCRRLSAIVGSSIGKSQPTKEVTDYVSAWEVCIKVLRKEIAVITKTPYYKRILEGQYKRLKRKKGDTYLQEDQKEMLGLEGYASDNSFWFELTDKKLGTDYKKVTNLPTHHGFHTAFRELFASVEYQTSLCTQLKEWNEVRLKKAEDAGTPVLEVSQLGGDGHNPTGMPMLTFLLSSDSQALEGNTKSGAFNCIANSFKSAARVGSYSQQPLSAEEASIGGGSKEEDSLLGVLRLKAYDKVRSDQVKEINALIRSINKAVAIQLGADESKQGHGYRKFQKKAYEKTICSALSIPVPSLSSASKEQETSPVLWLKNIKDLEIRFEQSNAWSKRSLSKVLDSLHKVTRDLRATHGIDCEPSSESLVSASEDSELKTREEYAEAVNVESPEGEYYYSVIHDANVIPRNLSKHCCLTSRDQKWRKISYGLRIFGAIPGGTPEAKQMKTDILLDVLDQLFTHRAWGYSGSWERGEAMTSTGRAFIRRLLLDQKVMALLTERSNSIQLDIPKSDKSLDAFEREHFSKIARSRRHLDDRLQAVPAVPESENRPATRQEVCRAYRWLSLLVEVNYRHKQDKKEVITGHQTGSFFGRHAHNWRKTFLDDAYDKACTEAFSSR